MNLSWWEIFLYPDKIKKILDFLANYINIKSLYWKFYCRLMTNWTLVNEEIVSQLRGIGGAHSVGFGKARVGSIADAVAKVLAEEYGFTVKKTNHLHFH